MKSTILTLAFFVTSTIAGSDSPLQSTPQSENDLRPPAASQATGANVFKFTSQTNGFTAPGTANRFFGAPKTETAASEPVKSLSPYAVQNPLNSRDYPALVTAAVENRLSQEHIDLIFTHILNPIRVRDFQEIRELEKLEKAEQCGTRLNASERKKLEVISPNPNIKFDHMTMDDLAALRPFKEDEVVYILLRACELRYSPKRHKESQNKIDKLKEVQTPEAAPTFGTLVSLIQNIKLREQLEALDWVLTCKASILDIAYNENDDTCATGENEENGQNDANGENGEDSESGSESIESGEPGHQKKRKTDEKTEGQKAVEQLRWLLKEARMNLGKPAAREKL